MKSEEKGSHAARSDKESAVRLARSRSPVSAIEQLPLLFAIQPRDNGRALPNRSPRYGDAHSIIQYPSGDQPRLDGKHHSPLLDGMPAQPHQP